eukprot:3047859-Amphidinium_carterae.1
MGNGLCSAAHHKLSLEAVQRQESTQTHLAFENIRSSWHGHLECCSMAFPCCVEWTHQGILGEVTILGAGL